MPRIRDHHFLGARDLPRDVVHRHQERGVVGADQHQRRHRDPRQTIDHPGVLLRQHAARRSGQPQRAAVLAHADLVAAAERGEALGFQVVAALAGTLVPGVTGLIFFEARAGVEQH